MKPTYASFPEFVSQNLIIARGTWGCWDGPHWLAVIVRWMKLWFWTESGKGRAILNGPELKTGLRAEPLSMGPRQGLSFRLARPFSLQLCGIVTRWTLDRAISTPVRCFVRFLSPFRQTVCSTLTRPRPLLKHSSAHYSLTLWSRISSK
jgi:hypothetical protein